LEERRRRERRRMKELNGLNGAEPEEEEDADAADKTGGQFPPRNPKASRSMSPNTGKGPFNTGHSLSSQLAARGNSPSAFVDSTGHPARDSFLKYFFGNDGPQNGGQFPTASGYPDRPGSRHVSNNIEPNFASSFRRGDSKIHDRLLPESPLENESRDKDSLMPWQNDAPALTEREALETELIRRLISSYFNIVRESIADQVPKAIMHLLVNHSKDVVQNRLVSELYKEGLFEELLYEDDGIKAEREKCEKLLRTYKEAAKIVGEVL